MIINLFLVLSLLYLGNDSRNIEKQNSNLAYQIILIKEQIKINEIEYTLYNNYSYLTHIYCSHYA